PSQVGAPLLCDAASASWYADGLGGRGLAGRHLVALRYDAPRTGRLPPLHPAECERSIVRATPLAERAIDAIDRVASCRSLSYIACPAAEILRFAKNFQWLALTSWPSRRSP